MFGNAAVKLGQYICISHLLSMSVRVDYFTFKEMITSSLSPLNFMIKPFPFRKCALLIWINAQRNPLGEYSLYPIRSTQLKHLKKAQSISLRPISRERSTLWGNPVAFYLFVHLSVQHQQALITSLYWFGGNNLRETSRCADKQKWSGIRVTCLTMLHDP